MRRGVARSDLVSLLLLVLVGIVLAVRWASGAPVARSLTIHILLLAVFGAVVAVLARFANAGWVPYARALGTVALMFTLYSTLGQAGFEAMPWTADAALARADQVLFFGTQPALAVAPLVTRPALECFSFVYAFFIPYLYMSILVGCVGRPAGERAEFLNGFALLYAASFLGYLFAPARGPGIYLASAFGSGLTGGTFYRLVLSGVASTGGDLGAFPSLHVGATAYACFFDLRTNPLRGLLYLPFLPLVAISTIVLRYHYVVDLIVGLGLAMAAGAVARSWRRA